MMMITYCTPETATIHSRQRSTRRLPPRTINKPLHDVQYMHACNCTSPPPPIAFSFPFCTALRRLQATHASDCAKRLPSRSSPPRESPQVPHSRLRGDLSRHFLAFGCFVFFFSFKGTNPRRSAISASPPSKPSLPRRDIIARDLAAGERETRRCCRRGTNSKKFSRGLGAGYGRPALEPPAPGDISSLPFARCHPRAPPGAPTLRDPHFGLAAGGTFVKDEERTASQCRGGGQLAGASQSGGCWCHRALLQRR